MANKTMHHVVIGADTFELVDEAGREETTALKEDLNQAIEDFAVPTQEAVDNWLNAHPEATTTVQDGSLTYKKFVTGTLGYVMPEMYGAKGDGVTDDSAAFLSAVKSGKRVLGLKTSTYYINSSLTYSNSSAEVVIKDCKIINNNGYLFDFNLKSIELDGCEIDGNSSGYGVFSTTSFFEYIKIYNCHIHNMESTVSNGWGSERALRVQVIKHALVDNCIISNNNGQGLIVHYQENTSPEIVISNCTAINNSHGLGIGCLTALTNNGNCTITNCVAKDNGYSGIASHGIHTVTITNCISNNNNEHGFVIMQSKNSIITGCSCTENVSSGIRVQGDFDLPEADRFCDNIMIANNVIKQSKAIYVGVSVTNITIRDNTILDVIIPIFTDNNESRLGCNKNSSNVVFINNIIKHKSYSAYLDQDYFSGFVVCDNRYADGTVYPNGKFRINYNSYAKIFISSGNLMKNITPYNSMEMTFSDLSQGTTYDATTKTLTLSEDKPTRAKVCEFRYSAKKVISFYCKIPDGFTLTIGFRNSGTLLGRTPMYTYNNQTGFINEFTITLVDVDLSSVSQVCITPETADSISAGNYTEMYIIGSEGYEVHGV